MIIAGNSHVSVFRNRLWKRRLNDPVKVKWVGAITAGHFVKNYSSTQVVRSIFFKTDDWKILSIGMHDMFLLCRAYSENRYEQIFDELISCYKKIFIELNSKGKFGWLISPQQLNGSVRYGIPEKRVFEFSQEFNEKLTDWCVEKGIVVINPLSKILGKNYLPKNELLQIDGIHLNDTAIKYYINEINKKTGESLIFVPREQSLENVLQAGTEPESLSLLVADELGLLWDQTKLPHGTRRQLENKLIHFISDRLSDSGIGISLERDTDYNYHNKLRSIDLVEIYTFASELFGEEINFDVNIRELNTVEKLSDFIYKNKPLTKNDFFESLTQDTSDNIRSSETFSADSRIAAMHDDMYMHLKEIIHLQTEGVNFGYGIIYFWFALIEAKRDNYGLALNLLQNAEDINLRFPFRSLRIENYRKLWEEKLVEQQKESNKKQAKKQNRTRKKYEYSDLWWPEGKFVCDEDDLLCELKYRGKEITEKVKTLYAVGVYDLKKCRLYFDIFKRLKKIYLFMPVPEVYEQLKKSVHNDARIEVFPYALTDTDGYDLLVTDIIDSRLSLHMGKQYDLISGKAISVECRTFEKFIESNELPLPDMLIFDIRGMEHRFYSSISPKYLSKIKINYFTTSKEAFSHRNLPNILFQQLFEKHFEYFGFAPFLKSAEQQGNVLFLNTHDINSIHDLHQQQTKILGKEISSSILKIKSNVVDECIDTDISKIIESLYSSGENLLNQGNIKDAFFAFQKTLAIDSQHLMAHYQLGKIFWKQMKLDDAEKYFAKAFLLDVSNKTIASSFVEFSIAAGNRKQAKNILTMYLRQNPEDETFMKLMASLDISHEGTVTDSPEETYQNIQSMVNSGHLEKAFAALEKLIEEFSDYALAHNDLGVMNYNRGDKEKALKHYEKAAWLEPENIIFQKNLADFYYVELSRVEEAMQIYVKVLNANPEDIETLFIIGQICVALKKFDDAKDFYSRILIVEPWNKDAKQFLEELEKCQLSVTGDRLDSKDLETASKEYLVSAIVSTYNSERFIRGCLEDLEAQTIADRMEIIVVNSGTEQNEETIVREFQQRYDNIKYIKTDDRETVYQAWNRGIRASKAKYITNANTDDRRYSDSIEVLVNMLEENPDVVLAYGNFKVTDTENCISGKANIIEEMDYPPYERGTLLRSCYPGPMPVWRKNVHDEFGYFNESFVSAGDREFWCRISQKYSLLHVKKHIGLYYRNPEGIENRNKRSGIVQQEAEHISRRYAKSFQLPWNDFRRINFHIEDNFPETKRALQELESSGGGFHVHVQISSCDLGEYLWLRQKRNEGLVHKLSLTQEGKRKFPSVAILMFTYNRLEYTQEALHTLMTNTRYPFDLYIVDNHSTDGTREWLEAVRLEYPDRIKDIRYNSTNEGLPGPTNDFWSRVDSELIGKVDNDTLVPTGWLERLVEAHQKIQKIAVVGGYHFRPEDFDDKSARLRLYEHDGIKILPDAHIGGCCYLMKKSIQKIFGPMKFNPALKIHGWTEYQHMLAGDGYIVGYIYPLIQLEYMDDPRSEKCLINEKYQDYTREIWRERGINFKSTDQVVDWLRRDAQRITNQPSSEASSLKSKNHKTKKSYYGYPRPEIQAIVSRKARKILDIGCGAGVLGKELKNRQKCYVAGIEYLPEAANKAETVLDRVYMGDAVKIMPEIPENSFDTIIMADFIEHVANPEEILLDVKRILTSKGKLVLSIPNVRHWSVIKDLLEGRWEYQDAGILDKTHIRFFTWQSILSLLNSAGYHIDSYSGTYLQGYDVPEKFINLSKQCGIDTSTLASEGRIYQYLITCTLKSEDELPESIISKQNALHDQITSIIILTLNQLEYTKKCIGSVFKHTKEPFELIVVDNGSTDGTVEFLESEVSARKSDVRVKVIRNRENLGFAAGNNQGMAAAMGDYILLMNNDIVVTPNWLERMVLCAEKNPKIGIVGPMSNYVSGPQLVKDVTYNTENLDGLNDFALEISNKNSGKAAPFWRVVGFCMLIKKAVIDKIGGLDVRYGLGNFEDDDFSLRATLAGYESRIVEDCFVHHFGNRTFLAAQIDYKKSLHKNWEIFKEKWGIPKDVPYGSSYDLSFLLKDGFIHSKHYFSIGETPDLQISKGKGILSSSTQEEYLKIEKLIATGKKQEAKEVLEKLLLDDPEFAMAHNDLGVLYFQAGDKAKALKHYERAVQLQPVSVTFLKNLADFYYVELDRVEDAMKLYVKILYLNSKDKETLLIMGHICVSLKKFDDAKEFYNRVLEIDPLNEDARQVLDKMLNHEQTVNPDINVSIIIPTSGQQKYIKKCVESIKKHTTQPHEIMFVNNGAAKGTTKWLKQCLKENSNYHMVKCPKDTGSAGIVNEGIKASTGEYILLLSNDVVVTKDWLNGMLESLKSTHDGGVVGPMSNNSRGAQKVSTAENISLVQLDKTAESFMTKNRYRRISSNSIDGFCMLFARDLVEKIGLFDEQFGHDGYEDEDFCLRAVLEGHINLIAGDVYVHRQNKKTVVLNKKIFNRKWNNADSHNLLGKKFLALAEIEKGREAYQRGNIDDAVELFLEGIRLSSDDKWPYYAFAEMLLQAKKCKDAIDILNEIPQDEQDIRRIELLGYCKEGMDLDQEAFGHADHALSINGNSAAALNLKGLLAFKQGEIRFAEDYFKKAMEADPGYGEPYTNLGAILWDSMPEDALDLFERGFFLSPMIPDIVTNYHSAITASGEYERAGQVFEEAGLLYPNSKMIKYQFIDMLIKQGKNTEAMHQIEDAIALFGADDGVLPAALKIRKLLGPTEINKVTKKKSTVSLCMIVKNEEKYLAKCLRSIKPVVDEMIVVDTGSTDMTKDIAKAFGAKVYDFEWNDDFSEARNFSISKASGKWNLVMDADEAISSIDYNKFKNTIERSKPFAYQFTTRNYTLLFNIIGWNANDEKYINENAGVGWTPSDKVRLFPNKPGVRFEYPIHELIEPSLKKAGIKVEKCKIPIHHYGKLNQKKNDDKGEIYYQIGRKKLDEMGDDEVALCELAIQAETLGKHEESIELWERLIKIKPETALAFVNMGTAYEKLGKYEKAVSAASKALEIDPEMVEAHYNYAFAKVHFGQVKEAISVLEKLINRISEYPPAQFLLSVAYCLEARKAKWRKGFENLRLTMGQGLAVACHEFAKGLVSAKRPDYAVTLLEAAIESKNSNKEIDELYSECLEMMNVDKKTGTMGDL